MSHHDTEDPDGHEGRGTVSDLLNRVIEQTREIARTEAELVRAEAAHRAGLARNAVILGAIALVFALGAIFPLTQSAIYGLEWAGLDRGPATLIVGAVLLILGIISALIAAAKLRKVSSPPTRLKENLSADAQALKESFK
ncbi:putative superfamily III holin-X [Thioclava sp. ES.031]|uniref:phage holin family protein n=1 Tax=Thioclava sp. ES.031 TaxID=1798203 RepID=UPI000BF7976C|nr:phage holin family protein [Thioclava sp. ES.031]PFG65154.1 putative superfamily III holin-X [Thioclava sp. ES.031]